MYKPMGIKIKYRGSLLLCPFNRIIIVGSFLRPIYLSKPEVLGWLVVLRMGPIL